MRRLVACRTVALLLAVALAALAAPAGAQSLDALYKRIEPAVVQVRCPGLGIEGSGFVWNRGDTVVSALHVVDRCGAIEVYYPVLKVARGARVLKVLSDADLVLLGVEDAPQTPVLAHTTQRPSLEEDVYCLGFPLGLRGVLNRIFRLAYGSDRLKDTVTEQARREIRDNGYPSLDLSIAKLGGDSLLPGLSGAPIFNRAGEVIAIGDGGLEQGAINISWGIPASYLGKLLASPTGTLPRALGSRNLFSAELRADVGTTVTAGRIDLVKLRTRSLTELIATADDQLGLQQLSYLFPDIDQASLRYDIYQEVQSGATVVLPEGARIEAHGAGVWAVQLPASYGRSLDMALQVSQAPSAYEAQRRSVEFEAEIQKRYPGLTWQVDPQWTYPLAYSRPDGLTVRRKAAGAFSFDGYNWLPNKYVFETLAVKNSTFLGLAVVNNENTPQAMQLAMMCNQGLPNPECPRLFQTRRGWAHAVLGVQVTSFSY